MAYAVHINPNAPLGDEAAVAALLVEDTEDEGIQATVARKETSYPSDGTVGGSNVTDDAQISSAFASRRRKDKNRSSPNAPGTSKIRIHGADKQKAGLNRKNHTSTCKVTESKGITTGGIEITIGKARGKQNNGVDAQFDSSSPRPPNPKVTAATKTDNRGADFVSGEAHVQGKRKYSGDLGAQLSLALVSRRSKNKNISIMSTGASEGRIIGNRNKQKVGGNRENNRNCKISESKGKTTGGIEANIGKARGGSQVNPTAPQVTRNKIPKKFPLAV